MTSAFIPKEQMDRVQTLLARDYHDPEIYEIERRYIFQEEWFLYGHEALLPAPGDYHAQTVAGYPLLIIRDNDGNLSGFHNVCRHRASMILDEGCGKAQSLRCMYHGWVYDMEGNLRRAPEFGGDEQTICNHYKLFPLHVKTWNGLIFVNMQKFPPDFDESLTGLAQILKGFAMDDYEYYKTAEHSLACNWKTYVENYMEGYHIPVVHPELNKEIDMTQYHVRTWHKIAVHETALKAGEEDRAESQGLWIWIWPHAALNIYQKGMNLELMIPDGPGKTILKYFYFKAPSVSDADMDKAIEMSRITTDQDQKICEIVQKNLQAGIYHHGELSPRHENGVAYFQDLIKKALDKSKTTL